MQAQLLEHIWFNSSIPQVSLLVPSLATHIHTKPHINRVWLSLTQISSILLSIGSQGFTSSVVASDNRGEAMATSMSKRLSVRSRRISEGQKGSFTTLFWETYCHEACSSQLFEDKVLHSLSSNL